MLQQSESLREELERNPVLSEHATVQVKAGGESVAMPVLNFGTIMLS